MGEELEGSTTYGQYAFRYFIRKKEVTLLKKQMKIRKQIDLQPSQAASMFTHHLSQRLATG
jgi:hypothetical protein